MPSIDITAARPVSGAPIETAWGDAVHDAIEGIQSGSVVVPVSANGSGDLVVVFPRPFAAAPTVVASINSTTAVWFCNAVSISATQCTIRVVHREFSTSTTNLAASWAAMGTLASPG